MATPLPTRTSPLPAAAPALDATPIELDRIKPVDVFAGRVTTLLANDDRGEVASVQIVKGPGFGHVTVNPDNSMALVLTDSLRAGPTSFTYKVTYADGRAETLTAKINAAPGLQSEGWGLGEHYVLETDADGRSIVEYGDNHRKVHISAGEDALSLADIAKLEGLDVSKITGAWLAKNPEYGATPEMALDQTAGMALWNTITGSKAAPSSHWLLFESGHTYDETKFLVKRGTQGESALNPVFIGAYGEGDKPVIANGQNYHTPDNANIVISGLEFTNGLQMIGGKNYLLEDLSIRNDTLTMKEVDNITLRLSDIIDVFRAESLSDGLWSPHINRISGVFANDNDGLLIEHILVDHTGWADDYKADLSLSGGQPPSIYSQGLYLSYGNTDLTLRDSILMRNASFGAQVRSGGVIEDNLFLDNNAAVNMLGGNDLGTHNTGNYSLMLGNVITSGGHRDVSAGPRGALTMGIDNSGRLTTLLDNIVAHLADPANPEELAEKPVSHKAVIEKFPLFSNDTIVYNWVGAKAVKAGTRVDTNVEGLNRNVLDATTIQKFTAQLLGKDTATIADLATFLRGQAEGRLDGKVDADIINAFFRAGFGLDTDIRDEAATLRFIPNALGDGVRWDNRINWDTGDLPGTQDGDSVDLGGNRVKFGGATVTVDDLEIGANGGLDVSSGKLSVDGALTTGAKGRVDIGGSGQVWVEGYADKDRLTLEMDGGRFANTGHVKTGINARVSEDAQFLAAVGDAKYDITNGSKLTLVGSDVKVGFDGINGQSAAFQIRNGGTLSFVGDKDGFASLKEVRSGAFGDAVSDVTSKVTLGGQLHINLFGVDIDAKGESWTLIDADEILFNFKWFDVDMLETDRDATIFVDHVRDEVRLVVGADGEGTGAFSVVTVDAPTTTSGLRTAGLDMDEIWSAIGY